MDKKVNFISYLLLCLAVLMSCISGLLTIKIIDDMKKNVNELKEQNETLIYKYELQEDELKEIKSLHSIYASETDAKIKLLSGEIQEMRLEKEANEAELHKASEPQLKVVGTYQLTAYIATGNPCADGQMPQVGLTAACNDPALWHKWVHIDGYGDYYIHDTGGMASNVIDIFVGSYDEAIQFGRRSATVSIIEK